MRTRTDDVLLRLGRAERGGKAFLSNAEREAGERFSRDFEFAGLQPSTSQSYEPTPKGQRGGPDDRGADAAIDARTRVGKALAAIGPELSGIVMDICGLQLGLEEVERQRGWPVRSGKLVLKLALGSLARHYGYSDEAVGPAREGTRLRGWMGAGARPSMRPAEPPAAHRP
ncbi:DUF6456 domain-containing protein [Aureimonas altamirensis]|uniref:DUF6456 domain-containing protein n=1 Tax=Aureimonas altamirensis TaxID=370622 RepID=UPI0020371296|nr:DUF6456 domain-containing protein [Aureimonas altamirensis]MCM2505077.1 DUF6456 domain-containing protein [Aureimonas altamirensis]